MTRAPHLFILLLMNDTNAAVRYAVEFPNEFRGTVTKGGEITIPANASDREIVEAVFAGESRGWWIMATPARAYGWEVGEWNGNLELYVGKNNAVAVRLIPIQ